jgi:hypothetical protein
MKRISCGLSECGEMLFIDSSGNVDRFGCKIFIIYINSCAGDLPIGVIILTSESMSVISEGLELWKKLLSPNFKGPKVFMTDDSAAERGGALCNIFPESKLLLCIFHILQATWRYLWDSHHGVPLCYRQILYSIVKKMIYSKNPKFESYLQKLYERKEQ